MVDKKTEQALNSASETLQELFKDFDEQKIIPKSLFTDPIVQKALNNSKGQEIS